MSALALPLTRDGMHLRDATGASIALLGGTMDEYRARGDLIITAVNSHVELLAAAKDINELLDQWYAPAVDFDNALIALKTAIANAERLLESHAGLLAAAKDFVETGDAFGSREKPVHLQAHYEAFRAAISKAGESAP